MAGGAGLCPAGAPTRSVPCETLKEIVDKAFEETWEVHERREISMRVAAYGLAVERVAEATMTRGLYP